MFSKNQHLHENIEELDLGEDKTAWLALYKARRPGEEAGRINVDPPSPQGSLTKDIPPLESFLVTLARCLLAARPGGWYWFGAAVFAVLVTMATFVPYLAQDAASPEDHVFSWLLTAIPDQASYLMWMDQHAQGVFLPQDRMTTEPLSPFLPNPVWMLLGWLSRPIGLIKAYHVGRAVFGLAYILLLAALFRAHFQAQRTAFLALVMASLGSGLAFIQALGLMVETADWMPELWSFSSLLYFPHFAAALALLALALLLIARGRGWLAGVTLAILVFVHPYTALPVGVAIALRAIVGRAQGIPWTDDLRALVVFAASMASMGLAIFLTPGMRTWAERNLMPSPPFWQYLLGLGLVLPLAFLAFVRYLCRREWDRARILWVAWILVTFILAYSSPLLPCERRVVEGVHIAFVAMATTLLGPVLERLKPAAAAAVIAIAGLLVAPTNALLVHREATAPNSGQIPKDWPDLWTTVRALPGERTVFSDARRSVFLAGLGGGTVYLGHQELTPDFERKLRTVHEFYARQASWPERLATIRTTGCRYLVLTPEDVLALGPDGPPASALVARGQTWALFGPLW